jgi:type I restriction enzyme S subunit
MSVTMNDSLVLRDDLDRRTESALRPDQHLLVRKGDIAYNMMRMWQGACGLATADGVVSPAYVVLAPRPGIDSRFAYHWFKSPRMIHLFWAYSHGLTEDRLRLYFSEFSEIPVVPPSLQHQRRIATALGAWDQAIAHTERLIAAKRRRLSSLMSKLVFTRSRAQGRGDISELVLKDLGKLVRGVTYDPATDIVEGNKAASVAVLTAGNIQAGQVSPVGEETHVSARCVRPDQLVKKGDFVLSMSNGSKNLVGKAGLLYEDLDEASAPGAFCAVFRPKSHTAGLVASMLFQSEGYREQLHIALAGSSINNLTNGELEDFTFHVSPTLSKAEPEFFRVVGDDLRKAEQALSKLRSQKRSLMQRLLTEDLRLGGSFA